MALSPFESHVSEKRTYYEYCRVHTKSRHVSLSSSSGCNTSFFEVEIKTNLQTEMIFLNITYHLARKCNWKRLQHSHQLLNSPLQSQKQHTKPQRVIFQQNVTTSSLCYILLILTATGSWKMCLSHVFHLYYTLNPIHWSNFPQ